MIVTAEHLLADLPDLIRQLLAELCLPIEHPEEKILVSGTIGATWVDGQVWDKDDLPHGADEALYAAKDVRRGTARVHGTQGLIEQTSASDHTTSARRLRHMREENSAERRSMEAVDWSVTRSSPRAAIL